MCVCECVCVCLCVCVCARVCVSPRPESKACSYQESPYQPKAADLTFHTHYQRIYLILWIYCEDESWTALCVLFNEYTVEYSIKNSLMSCLSRASEK